jgi:TonB dependent receptor
VTTTRDPLTEERLTPVDPLVRTLGAEIGLRTQVIPDVTATLAAFWLESDSELVYIGDAGTNEAGPGSRRIGLEASAYWRPAPWLTVDAEAAVTRGRFIDAGNEDQIPNSIPYMVSGGVTIGAAPDGEGFFTSLRTRAFGARTLTEDGSQQGHPSFLVNASLGYRQKNWEAAIDFLNVFDRRDNDIEYRYQSRLPGEDSAGLDDTHFHPTEPRTVRLRVTYHF